MFTRKKRRRAEPDLACALLEVRRRGRADAERHEPSVRRLEELDLAPVRRLPSATPRHLRLHLRVLLVGRGEDPIVEQRRLACRRTPRRERRDERRKSIHRKRKVGARENQSKHNDQRARVAPRAGREKPPGGRRAAGGTLWDPPPRRDASSFADVSDNVHPPVSVWPRPRARSRVRSPSATAISRSRVRAFAHSLSLAWTEHNERRSHREH